MQSVARRRLPPRRVSELTALAMVRTSGPLEAACFWLSARTVRSLRVTSTSTSERSAPNPGVPSLRARFIGRPPYERGIALSNLGPRAKLAAEQAWRVPESVQVRAAREKQGR